MLTYGLRLAGQRFRQRSAMLALVVVMMTVGIVACMKAGTMAEAGSGERLLGIGPHLHLPVLGLLSLAGIIRRVAWTPPVEVMRNG